MTISQIDARTSKRNLAQNYALVGLQSETWTAVELPIGTTVVDARSQSEVVCRAADTITVPTVAPGGTGSLLPGSFQVTSSSTYLHLYSLSTTGDTVQLNFFAV